MIRIEDSNNSSNLVSKSTMEISHAESGMGSEEGNCGEEVKAESKSDAAEIKVNVIHNHVNLKIQCSRRPGQLLQAIVTLESLRLTVLHLNITSSQASVLYSFNLKVILICILVFFFYNLGLDCSTSPGSNPSCKISQHLSCFFVGFVLFFSGVCWEW